MHADRNDLLGIPVPRTGRSDFRKPMGLGPVLLAVAIVHLTTGDRHAILVVRQETGGAGRFCAAARSDLLLLNG